jgi:DmsE family decaheme c-type cytochrome
MHKTLANRTLRKHVLMLGVLTLAAAMPAGAQERDEEIGYSKKGADTCLMCHGDDELNSIFQTPHGNPGDARAPFGPGQAQCEACHGPGGKHTGRRKAGEPRPAMPYFAEGSKASVEDMNGQCLNCHTQQLGSGWHGSVHETNGKACVDCHQIHVPKDRLFSRAEQAEVCYTCHLEQKAQFQKAYVHPVRYGKMACTECHNPHGSAAADASLNRPSLNQQCYECHAEYRGPYLWEHAPVSEDCSLCHNPHGSNHPALLVKRPPLLCQSCHSQAGHPSVIYTADSVANANINVVQGGCLNCHSQVHGSNHPSGVQLSR